MAATDNYSSYVSALDSPAINAAAVTKHDTNDLTYASRALYIGVTGDVVVNMAGTGSAITFKAVPVGVLPIRVTRVLSTGTTATDIVSLW